MANGARVAPLFPAEDPQKKLGSSNVRLERQLWDRLDSVAKKEKRSRNDVIAFFLEWACDDYEKRSGRK